MEKINLSIPSISCKHCVITIKNELSEINGVLTVEGDSEKKEITVAWDAPVTLKKIKTVLDEINYPVAE